MQESPFHAFLSLIRFDQETNVLRRQIEALQQEIVKLKEEKISLGKKLESAQQEWHTARKSVDERELAMKELEAQRIHKTTLLETLTSQKEHLAVRRELDSIKQKQHDIEQELIDVWNVLEASKKALDARTKTIEPERIKLDELFNQKESSIHHLEAQIADREKVRHLKTQGLPEEWLEKYSMMRTSVEDPAVPIQNDACSVCFHSLSKPDLLSLYRNKLLQCKGCFRFLYIDTSKPSA